MFLRRSALALPRWTATKPIAARTFSSSIIRRFSGDAHHPPAKDRKPPGRLVPFDEVETEEDLQPPGAAPGTMPTDYEQATGLERLEILGKMQGVDIFDMKPLDASRLGTLDNPIVVRSFGDEQYAGCTGFPVDSHWVKWLTLSRSRPVERCPECGNVLKMEYVGPPDDPHAHEDGHHGYQEPKTFADFVRPEYR